MNRFEINGQGQDMPAEGLEHFGNLMGHVHSRIAVGGKVVSEVRVNGIALGEGDEDALSGIPLQEIDSVEIDMMDARTLASETLQMLDPFLDELAGVSVQCVGTPNLTRLIDGVSVLTDSLHQIGMVLGGEGMGPENESKITELKHLLRDLIRQAESGISATRRDMILASRLPELFESWRTEALPVLASKLAN